MKKTVSLILVFIVLISICSFVGLAENKLIFTDGFEDNFDATWKYLDKVSRENTRVLSDAYSEGEKAYYFYDGSDSSSVGIKSNFIEVKEGETYTACADIYTISGTVAMYFKYYDENSKQIFSKSIKGTKGKWATVTIKETAPEGAIKCQITLCGNNASFGEGFYDNIRLYKGEVTSSYSFDKAKVPEGSLAPQTKGPEDIYNEGDVIFFEEFEDDIFKRWRAKGDAKLELRTDIVKGGKQSLYISDDSAEGAGGIISQSYPATEGATYSVTADVYNLVGILPVYLKFFDEKGEILSNTSKGSADRNFWDIIVHSVEAPEGTATVQVWVYTAVSTKRTGYIDNLKLIKGKVDTSEPEYEYISPKQSQPVNASIVAPVDNKLVYTPYTDKGDVIGDYSYGGFYGGEFELPVSSNLPVIATVSPSGTEDDTKMLQDVIDKAYSENTDGKMKIIKLKAGTYYINKTGIRLKSNLVLSGEGQGPTGTILYAKDPVNYFLLRVEGTEPVKVGNEANITDDYLPAGSKKFHISEADIKNFAVGDLITVFHPSTEEWSQAMGMQGIISTTNVDSSWNLGEVDTKSERIITAINGTEITIDFPIYIPMDKTYSQATIYKTDESTRIHDAGVENLRLQSYYNGNLNDESHSTVAVAITNAKNIFVRDISAKFFYSSAVSCRQGAKQVTVLNCSSLKPASQITGSRRYSFACAKDTQQLMFTGCYSYDGRHDFEASYPSTGPIAFVDNVVDKSNSATEAHGTWSNAILYDNIYQIGNRTQGMIALANRGVYGTSLSQGWSSASSVVWNCLSSSIVVNKPPLTYQNFVVGTWGLYQDEYAKMRKETWLETYKATYKTGTQPTALPSNHPTKEGSPVIGDCYIENEFTPVEPRSLYKAQLSERFTGTIQNARPNAPIIVYPRSDKETENKKVDITGVYQLGAEAVTIYIDNEPHKATLNSSNNTFSLSVELHEGVHKIYATQTIKGVEGCKNADRFITIGKANGNPDYLQSIYEPEKTKMLLNDTRVTFDKFQYGENDVITVTVNNKRLLSDVAPYETQGRVLVPMRAIFETLNAEVLWDDETKTATAVKGEITVKITENKKTTYVNGKPYELDVPATITNGRFVVPVRFISESFGADVAWIDATKTVIITGAK